MIGVGEKNGSYVWLWLTSAKEMEEKEGTINSAILFSLELLELNHKLTLREYQVKVLHALLKGTKSVFVSQPTGSGKSLLYQLLPFAVDFNKAKERGDLTPSKGKETDIILIVSPLISLIKDQMKKIINEYKLTAIDIGEVKDNETRDWLHNGKFTFVFGSPESFLNVKTRDMLKAKVYQENVIAVFIDESHCVAKW